MRSLPGYALPEVEGDLRAAMSHYDSWRRDGATHLLRLYEATIAWICWNPEAFPKKLGPVRRAILKHSYYIVYFMIEADRTLVLAVLDGRRQPTEIASTLSIRKSRGSTKRGSRADPQT